jgi:caspase domain-containing protein/uncharacterized protein DUF4384
VRRFASLLVIVLVVPLMAFGPDDRTASTRWAFVVGISDYINFDDVEGGDLPGAEHDARSMRDMLLMKYNLPEENIMMLLNQDATRAAMEEGITGWLVENARPGDQITIFFAGHGSQMWDESGDEDDGLDETLAPADVDPTSTEFDISDDTFNDWLSMLPSDNVIVFLDNCNSGTGTRDVTPLSRGRLLGRDINDVEKPATVSRRALPGQDDETGFDADGARVLELAAAQPFQQAVDAFFPAGDGQEPFYGGAFTTHMVRELWRAGADDTYEDAFQDAYEALKRNRFQQDPQISQDVSLRSFPIFFVEGGDDGIVDGMIPIASASGSTAELAGGMVLGITRGSVLETEDGAKLVVSAVGQRTTTVDVVEGSVDEGDLARLVGFRYSETPLLVNTGSADSEAIAALRNALGGDAGVRLVEEEDAFSHLFLRRLGEQTRIVGSDGFVRQGGLPTGSAAGAPVADALLREAAARRLADMENPGQRYGVELEMTDGRTSFGLGETVKFSIKSERAGYVTLVDLGTDGTVAMLLPNGDQPSMRIEAGGTLEYPSADSGVDLQFLEPIGRGMVRAFVTDEPLDITIGAGETYAYGGAEFADVVARAVQKAAGTESGAVLLDSWATASIVYEITN